MLSRIVVLMGLWVAMVWAEPSVYRSTYSSDKRIKANQTEIFKLHQQVDQLREEIDGLRSVIEGLNRAVGVLQQSSSSSRDTKRIAELSDRLDRVRRRCATKTELKQALAKRSTTLPVSKTPVASKPSAPKPASSAASGTVTGSLNSASSSALYSRGVRLVAQKRYREAKRRFDILAARGYKKAPTHFYLGEIAYHTGAYDTAVDQYKRSAEANEHAAYMDKLLLHTGLALEKKGDKAQARRFFQAIVDGYPNTASARIAKKHL